MTIKPKARKFRLRRAAPLIVATRPDATGPDSTTRAAAPASPQVTAQVAPDPRAGAAPAAAAGGAPDRAAASFPAAAQPARAPDTGIGPTDMAAIRAEGLTGRQLRMARRVALKHGLTVASDFDAVRQLRSRGIDPFQRSNILELVVPDAQPQPPGGPAGADDAPQAVALGRIQLPQTVDPGGKLPSTDRASPADRRASEIMKIQRDMARRRRRRMALLFARLSVFVFLPTLIAGWYFFVIATPMYATNSEFVIQQAEPAGAAGLGGLFQGTSMATQQDSITVQSYLTSRAAMVRLDGERGFKDHFSQPWIDPIQRLPDGASNEEAYRLYQKHVRISYDPTEGIVKMEVIAADPATSQQFSEALIAYAEEQVDQLTQRLRGDQMAGARASYDAAEARRGEALATLLRIQQEVQQIDPVGETAARTAQISALETQRQQLQLELQTRLSVNRPNQAQVDALRSQISGIEGLIGDLRSEMTQAAAGESSLATKNTELRLAEENYTFQTALVQQALQQMEAAQIEANRQVRYLSLGVEPVAPDEPSYPRAVENTAIAFLIFAGIYLMLSLTASILREQVAG